MRNLAVKVEKNLNNQSQCKGLVFRGYRSTFASPEHIGSRVGLKLLKRKSCKGCPECKRMMALLQDDISSGASEMWDDYNIENGRLYRIQVTRVDRDWETNAIEGWTWGAVEIKEESNE